MRGDWMEELVKKYSKLQQSIYRVIRENNYGRDDNFVDEIDQLGFTEEEFSLYLENYLISLQESDVSSEV